MMTVWRPGLIATTTLTFALLAAVSAAGGREPETNQERAPQVVRLAGGKLQLRVPGQWQAKPPRNRIIEHEFSVSPEDGDAAPGRMTIMRSGGGVEANIQRWKGQFTPPDNADPDEASKVEKRTVDGLEVHLVDLSGTFHDRPRPFGPATDREGYRMLAAIVRTQGAGDYFVKFYGPQKTVAAHAEAFLKMMEQLQWSGDS